MNFSFIRTKFKITPLYASFGIQRCKKAKFNKFKAWLRLSHAYTYKLSATDCDSGSMPSGESHKNNLTVSARDISLYM